jgi:hypothetical protein
MDGMTKAVEVLGEGLEHREAVIEQIRAEAQQQIQQLAAVNEEAQRMIKERDARIAELEAQVDPPDVPPGTACTACEGQAPTTEEGPCDGAPVEVVVGVEVDAPALDHILIDALMAAADALQTISIAQTSREERVSTAAHWLKGLGERGFILVADPRVALDWRGDDPRVAAPCGAANVELKPCEGAVPPGMDGPGSPGGTAYPVMD